MRVVAVPGDDENEDGYDAETAYHGKAAAMPTTMTKSRWSRTTKVTVTARHGIDELVPADGDDGSDGNGRADDCGDGDAHGVDGNDEGHVD